MTSRMPMRTRRHASEGGLHPERSGGRGGARPSAARGSTGQPAA